MQGAKVVSRYKVSIAKPRIAQRAQMHPTARRAGDRCSDRDVAKVGDIAPDARGHRSVRRWTSHHHHVWLFRHGSIAPCEKDRAFSHIGNQACEWPIDQADRCDDHSWNTYGSPDDYAEHLRPV